MKRLKDVMAVKHDSQYSRYEAVTPRQAQFRLSPHQSFKILLSRPISECRSSLSPANSTAYRQYRCTLQLAHPYDPRNIEVLAAPYCLVLEYCAIFSIELLKAVCTPESQGQSWPPGCVFLLVEHDVERQRRWERPYGR